MTPRLDSSEISNELYRVKVEVRPGGRPPPRVVINRDHTGGRFEVPQGGRVEFQNVRFTDVDFRRLRFDLFVGSGSVFTGCDFRDVRFAAGHLGNLSQTVYHACRFDRAHLAGVDPLYARFERCSFDDADLMQWRAFQAEFVECHFRGRIVEAKFGGKLGDAAAARIQPPRIKNEFRGNDFRQATLVDCSFFDGIDLTAQLLPTGPEYILLDNIRGRIRRARADISRWGDDRTRGEALLMLRVYESVSRGQDQLFARRDDIGTPAPLRDKVWDLLRQAL